MRDYNGFTGAQRAKAQRWLNQQWAAGAFLRPSQCCACGQTHGIIDAHAEDYSEPFAHGKTDEYPLCFACHMMVHCRFRSRAAWTLYRSAIGDGWRPPAFHSRNFPGFLRDVMAPLERGAVGTAWTSGHPRPIRRYLDGINGRDR